MFNGVRLKIKKKKIIKEIENDPIYFNYDEYKSRFRYRELLINSIKYSKSSKDIDTIIRLHNTMESNNWSYKQRIRALANIHDLFNDMVTLVTVL